jgi:hypothetical protein
MALGGSYRDGMNWIRNHLKIVLPATAVVIAGVAYLAFGIFGVHTLFIDDKVDDAGPVFDSGVAASDIVPDDPSDVPASTDAPTRMRRPASLASLRPRTPLRRSPRRRRPRS